MMDNIKYGLIEKYSYEDARMPIAWYLFIDENGSSFATLSDTIPIKKL